MLLDRGCSRRKGRLRLTGEVARSRCRDAPRPDRGPARRSPRPRSGGSSRTAPSSARPSAAGAGGSLGSTRRARAPPLRARAERSPLRCRPIRAPPSTGQYGFLQDLVRHVAYETLSRHERKSRHLAAADQLSASLGEEEVAEVVAFHLLAAFEAVPKPRTPRSSRDARRTRSCAPVSGRPASRPRPRLSGTASRPESSPKTPQRAGRAARPCRARWRVAGGRRTNGAVAVRARRSQLYEQAGDTHAAARVSSRLWHVAELESGARGEAIERMERAYAVIAERRARRRSRRSSSCALGARRTGRSGNRDRASPS